MLNPSPPIPPVTISTAPGRPLPLGATVTAKAINFSLFCRQATMVTLVLFRPGSATGSQTIPLTAPCHRTGDIWHVEVYGIASDWTYCYQILGQEAGSAPQGQAVLDPYAKRLAGGENWGKPASGSWRCGIVADEFDWQGDHPLNRPLGETIIYELHVRGFTRHASARVKHPGTFLGLIEKIPYLQELGVTALELLPTAEFDENENKAIDPASGELLKNFWGYSPVAYFAPKASFAFVPGQQINEFKTMVRALHQAGIEVILDVVFNHTAEGNKEGPTISFKVLGNSVYYLLEEEKEEEYQNFSGCGNTVNSNHPVVREFIIDCLRYWVLEMHVDGFRFDLASIMTRGRGGEVVSHPALVEQIAEDPVLADTKIIAEAWDASGLYQVGHFSNNPRWVEWNGRFRDDCRAFLADVGGNVSKFATRIAGSSDLYQHNQRRPTNSINFLTSHDGFTLWDLVSYNRKHNEQNGEHNQDGENHNLSWNSGKEGESHSLKVLTLRARRVRTMAVVLLLSQGVPMLVAGDEFCRTQHGNNNAYCQDNPVSWLDWRLADKNADTLRFFQMLIGLRKRYRVFRRSEFFPPPGFRRPEIIWQGATLGKEEWSPECKLLCFTLIGKAAGHEPDFFIAINSYHHDTIVEVPPPTNGGTWRQVINTALFSPHDIVNEESGPLLKSSTISVAALAAVVLSATEKAS